MGNADSIVRNTHHNGLLPGLCLKNDSPMGWSVFHSIIQQVEKQADQVIRAGQNTEARSDMGDELQMLKISQRLNLGSDGQQIVAEVNELKSDNLMIPLQT